MKEVFKNLYVGNESDYYKLEKETDYTLRGWDVVHACKEPFHRNLLGYSGRGCPKDNPEYLFADRGNRLYLNMVDANNGLFFDKSMIDYTLNYIGGALDLGDKVLVHCNEGLSRSPSLALLYLLREGIIVGKTLEDCEAKFLKVYPQYNPGKGIRDFVKEHFKEYAFSFNWVVDKLTEQIEEAKELDISMGKQIP